MPVVFFLHGYIRICCAEGSRIFKSRCTITVGRKNTNTTVNSERVKTVNTAIVGEGERPYLCSQKLIDVQQTLIKNPNPLKRTISTNPGKTNNKI